MQRSIHFHIDIISKDTHKPKHTHVRVIFLFEYHPPFNYFGLHIDQEQASNDNNKRIFSDCAEVSVVELYLVQQIFNVTPV